MLRQDPSGHNQVKQCITDDRNNMSIYKAHNVSKQAESEAKYNSASRTSRIHWDVKRW